MNLTLKVGWLKQLAKAGGTKIETHWHRAEDNTCDINIEKMTEDDFEKLLAIFEEELKKPDGMLRVARNAKMNLNAYIRVQQNPEKRVIKKLETLQAALKVYIGKSKHKYLFTEMDDGNVVPFYVSSIKYNPPSAHYGRAADTTLSMIADFRGQKLEKTIHWHRHQLGKTVSELLTKAGYFLETDELYDGYIADLDTYNKYVSLTGEQFLASGEAIVTVKYEGSKTLSMVRDNQPTKVVIDDEWNDEETGKRPLKSVEVDADFWNKNSNHDAEDTDATESVLAPVHPYLNVFNLDRHFFADIHVTNLKPYVYDPKLIDKLVLSDKKKELVSVLVESASSQYEDIIKGKTGGTIILETGPAGTGKTLTAQVYSEVIQRPLYSVQCSQLGTDEAELEKALSPVLGRATRWKAILLVDEADVYIHERGEDIRQNAVVGVWLQVLETYRGVLFMTTNREVIIDDAIMSRATAVVRYTMPDQEMLAAIWKILSTQYGLKLTPDEIKQLVTHEKLAHISGRNVKSLLKLAIPLAKHRKCAVSVDTFVYVSEYLELGDTAKKRHANSNNQPSELPSNSRLVLQEQT